MASEIQMDMLSGRLMPKIMRFAIPLAFTGIFQQLFNAVDIAIVGQFVGTNAMAAVGSSSPIIGLLLYLFVGISMGANVTISRFTGQRNFPAANRAAHTAVLLGLFSGILLLILGEIVMVPVLQLLSVPDEVIAMSSLYLRIYFAGMPVITLYNFEAAICQSQGNTRVPLLCLTASGIINVALHLFFVLGLHMAVEGVALATVISNIISAGLLFFFLLHSDGKIRLRMDEFRIDREIVAQILRIGVPAGIQSSLFSLSNIIIQSAINSLGAVVMAGSSAAFNIEVMAYYVINSFGNAATTFVGQNYGAGNRDRCREVMRTALLLDMAVGGILVSGMLFLLGTPLLSLFNSDPAVIANGRIRLLYILLFEFINVVEEIISGTLRGYGISVQPAITALVGICGVRIVWVYTVFTSHPTFAVLMQVYPVSWTVTVAALLVVYSIQFRRVWEKEGETEKTSAED